MSRSTLPHVLRATELISRVIQETLRIPSSIRTTWSFHRKMLTLTSQRDIVLTSMKVDGKLKQNWSFLCLYVYLSWKTFRRITIAWSRLSFKKGCVYLRPSITSPPNTDRCVTVTDIEHLFYIHRWFSHCLHTNLNGRYNLGLTWYDLSRNEWVAVKNTIMMITKRHECLSPSDEIYDNSSNETSDSSQTLATRSPIWN